MHAVTHAVSWFEIAVADFARAQRFYSAIFDYAMPEMQMGPVRMGMLPCDPAANGVGGAICFGEGYVPRPDGTLVYLNGGSDLSTVLARIEPAGGKILQPKTQITPEYGYFALFMDSEGNRMGLHSLA